MDRKELYLNARKAFRLVYEIQDSIIEVVEYIRSKIRYEAHAGRQIFSDPIERYKSPIGGGADQKFGEGRWSWDYFPSFMYMYYFTGKPKGSQNYSFSITQVMDDGFTNMTDSDFVLSTEKFKEPARSESYFLFAFSSWEGTKQYSFYDDASLTESTDEVAEKIIKISNSIEKNGCEPYIRSDRGTTIVTRFPLEALGSKGEVDDLLKIFAQLVEQKTGYRLLNE